MLVERSPDRLVDRHRSLLVLLEPNGERELGEIETFPSVLRAGAFVYVDPLVIDLSTGTVVGEPPMRQRVEPFYTTHARGLAMGIASDGRILVGVGVPEGRPWRRDSFSLGPLEWIRPVRP
jgi:hypothetical protein